MSLPPTQERPQPELTRPDTARRFVDTIGQKIGYPIPVPSDFDIEHGLKATSGDNTGYLGTYMFGEPKAIKLTLDTAPSLKFSPPPDDGNIRAVIRVKPREAPKDLEESRSVGIGDYYTLYQKGDEFRLEKHPRNYFAEALKKARQTGGKALESPEGRSNLAQESLRAMDEQKRQDLEAGLGSVQEDVAQELLRAIDEGTLDDSLEPRFW